MFDLSRRWSANLDELQREMERYLDHVTHRKPRQVVFSQRAWQPPVDIYETTDAVVALVDLSGVAEEDIDLVVTRDSFQVRGERREMREGAERTYSCIEIPFGRFERIVRLSTPVNPDETTASYRQGFLEVVMPRARANGPRHVGVAQA